MLKFNINKIKCVHKWVRYLNTSYVKVQYEAEAKAICVRENLNTSYVKVQSFSVTSSSSLGYNLNTSYVKVQSK